MSLITLFRAYVIASNDVRRLILEEAMLSDSFRYRDARKSTDKMLRRLRLKAKLEKEILMRAKTYDMEND